LIIKAINESKLTWNKDINKGGLAGSLLPILASGHAVHINTKAVIGTRDPLSILFSESGGRFLVLTDDPQWFHIQASRKGIVASTIGKVTKGKASLFLDDVELPLEREVERYLNMLEEELS
jgi:phosphoribosylformylglycinamidine synthase